MTPPAYEMRSKSKYYGKLCLVCSQRIRAGKSFVIDPINKLPYHLLCWENGSR